MELLDTRGFVYDVYDLGDGRVLKKEKPVAQQYAQHLLHGHSPEYVKKHKEQAARLLAGITNLELLGNPVFSHDGSSYTQDKVKVMDGYLKSHSIEEGKRAVDGYIASVFAAWHEGFSDIIFNFDRNGGVAPDGRVVLIDFNEVAFTKEETAERISIERWLNCAAYRELPEGEVKEYYADAMGKAMTMENLDKYWRDNALLHE